MVDTSGRTENLLAACSLAVAERVVNAAEDAVALGAGEAAALVSLHMFLGGASIDRLARVIGLSHPGAVRLVDRLEGLGMVQRRTSADDRRAVALALTRRGRTAARRILESRRDAMSEILAALPVEEQPQMAKLLEALLIGMASDRASAQHTCRFCDVDACGHPERCPVTLGTAH